VAKVVEDGGHLLLHKEQSTSFAGSSIYSNPLKLMKNTKTPRFLSITLSQNLPGGYARSPQPVSPVMIVALSMV